jgi:hypothetical protein
MGISACGASKTRWGSVDYHGTIYQDAVDAEAFDNGVVALLHNVNGKWKLVQQVRLSLNVTKKNCIRSNPF